MASQMGKKHSIVSNVRPIARNMLLFNGTAFANGCGAISSSSGKTGLGAPACWPRRGNVAGTRWLGAKPRRGCGGAFPGYGGRGCSRGVPAQAADACAAGM
eukprot:CAMPEP_0179077440 /NCGR_PEP_ID=MMETSP0796-20121207/34615_1 /TAXON_ID=73915 /ORGANISM="Pyrodinium bahamense, Strain pbaha01" /LENGTH=100 /DNA_ID=CAMNT_0020774719 /DNA_START=876 /DNA_END=1178 /DNA_ORIENTATION=-